MVKKFFLLSVMVALATSIAFAEQGAINVNVFPLPPALSASVQFYEPSGNNMLDADETGKLIINIQNNGKGDAFDVSAGISANKRLDGLSYDRTVSIGTVEAGRSVSKEVELRASEDMPTENLSFDVEVKEANGFDAQPVKIAFRTKAFEPPKLVVADIGIEDQNKNYKVEPMEIVEITARVQNMGYGDARNVTANAQFGDNVFVAGDSTTNFDLGSIPAGKFKYVEEKGRKKGRKKGQA